MTKEEILDYIVDMWEKCDEECYDCILTKCVNIYGRDITICRIISQSWKVSIKEVIKGVIK